MKTARLKWPAAYHLALSDDDRMIACVGRSVTVIDLQNRVRLSKSNPLPHPSYGSFSPNGEMLAVKSTSGKIVTIDPKTGATLTDFQNRRDEEGCEVLFSPGGTELIDGSWAGTITIRDSANGSIVFRDRYAGEQLTRISHDRERRLWLVQHSPKVMEGENHPSPAYVSLHHWPIAGGVARAFAFDMHIETAQISPDGMRFCFFQKWDERRVHIARVSDGQIIASSPTINAGGTGSELVWSPDSAIIIAVVDGKFVIMKADCLSVIGTKTVEYPSSAAFMRNGGHLVLGSWKESIFENTASLIEG